MELITPSNPDRIVLDEANQLATDPTPSAEASIELPAMIPVISPETNTPLAHLATPADTGLLPGAAFVDNSANATSTKLDQVPMGAEFAPVESAHFDARSMAILAPLNQPEGRKWSASLRSGYSWIDRPRISDDDRNGGGDSILTAGLSLGYVLPGSDEDRKFTFAGAYNYSYYAKNTDLNGDDASVSLGGSFAFGDTSLNFSASWNRSNGSNRLVADEISSDAVSASLGLSRRISDKTSLLVGAQYSLTSYESFLGSSSVGYYVGASYAFSEKTNFGLTYNAGLSDQDESASQSYRSLNLTLGLKPSPKTTLSGSIGYQDSSSDSSEYEGSGPGLVFSLASGLQITEKISISLSANRGASGSPLQRNQDVTTTRGILSVAWRINEQLTFSSGLGYSMDEYSGDFPDETEKGASRSNDYWTFRSSLSYRLGRRWSSEIFYQYSKNESSREDNNYQSNQFGASLSFIF